MPWGVAAAAVGGIASAATSSALAPGTSTGSNNLYIPNNPYYADQTIQNELAGQVAATSNGNPYSQGYQNAANTAGQQYGQLANTVGGYASQLGGQATANYGSQAYLQQQGQNVYNQATDANQAGYNLALTNLNSQQNAQQALRGLGNSAVGASEIGNTDANFGINWNTQQVQNSLAGLQGLDQAYGTAGSYGQLGNADLQGAAQMGALAPQYQLAAGQTPYAAANQMTSDQLGYDQGITGQAQTYLNSAIGATGTAYGQGQQNAQNVGASLASGIGSASQNIGNLFGSTGSTTANSFNSGAGSASQPAYNPGSFGVGGLGSSAQNYYSSANAYGFS